MGKTFVAASDETMCMIRTADGERLVTPLGPDLARVAVEHARPIREVISYKQKRSFEGDYWSATLGCLVHHESGLEKRFAVEADFRREVVAYSWQPLIFSWPRGTPGRRDHVPDFFCRLDIGDGLVVDVKSADHTEAAADQFALTRTACETVGWQYEVFSGWEPQRAFNMEHLCTYRRTRFIPTPPVRDAALTAFDGGASFNLGMRRLMREAALPEHEARMHLYNMMWHQQLTFDLEQPLRSSTIVTAQNP